MEFHEETRRATGDELERLGYPLAHTARVLNDRLGLYLSEPQQRVFAGVLLVGTALTSAALAWGLGSALRRSLG